MNTKARTLDALDHLEPAAKVLHDAQGEGAPRRLIDDAWGVIYMCVCVRAQGRGMYRVCVCMRVFGEDERGKQK